VCFERTRGVGVFRYAFGVEKRERDREQAASSSLSHPFPFIQLPFLRTPRTKWPRGQGEAQTSKGSLSSRATPRISPFRPTPLTGRERRSREKSSELFFSPCRASANAHNCLSVFLHQVSSTFLIFLLSLTYNDALKRIVASFACAQSWKIIDGTRAATGAVEASSFSFRFFLCCFGENPVNDCVLALVPLRFVSQRLRTPE